MFNAQEYMEDVEPPTFIDLSGEKYVGRVLSAPEQDRLTARLLEYAAAGQQTPAEVGKRIEALVLEVVTAAGFEPPEKVAAALLALPVAGLFEALSDFIVVSRRKRAA